jgi:hypothetical protein
MLPVWPDGMRRTWRTVERDAPPHFHMLIMQSSLPLTSFVPSRFHEILLTQPCNRYREEDHVGAAVHRGAQRQLDEG